MKKIILIMIGLSTALFASFSKNGNIVTDSNTGLQWQDDAIGTMMSWAAAIDHCEDLNLDLQNDWRLPNIKELISIMDDTKINPSMEGAVFANTASDIYWSSTTFAYYSNYAWHVYFYNGFQDYYKKSDGGYVRCVRTGQ